MTWRHPLAIGTFAFRTTLRTWVTRAGWLGAVLILLLGPSLSLVTGRGWVLDPELAFYAVLVALIFGLRSGLEAQRQDDLDLFLSHNLVTRVEYALGVIVSLIVSWATICAGAWLALLLVSGGDMALATWHAASWGLRSAVLLGFIPLIEKVSSLRLPFILPAIGYLFTMIALSVFVGEERAMAILVTPRREDPSTLIPLAVHAVAVGTATLGGFLLWAGPEQRRVSRRQQIVPVRHGAAPPPA